MSSAHFHFWAAAGTIVRLLCWVLITQPLVHIVCKFSKSCPHEFTCTHISTHRIMFHPLKNASLTCILRKQTGDMTLHLSELRICQIFPSFGAATVFLASLLPPRRPSSERHQAAIATSRLWETEIRSLQTRGSRNWRTWFFFLPPLLWNQSPWSRNNKDPTKTLTESCLWLERKGVNQI